MPNDDLVVSSLAEFIQRLDWFYNDKAGQLRKTNAEQARIIEESESSIRARSQAGELRILNVKYREAFAKSRDADANAEEKKAAESEAEVLHKRVREMAQRVANEDHDPQIVNWRDRKQAAEEKMKSADRQLDTLNAQFKNLHRPNIGSLYGALFDRSKRAVRQNTANELRSELKFFSDSIQPGKGGDPATEAMHAELLKYVSSDLINRAQEYLAAYASPAPALVVPAAGASSSSVVSVAAAPALVAPAANSSAVAHISGSVAGSSASYIPDESEAKPPDGNSVEMIAFHRQS